MILPDTSVWIDFLGKRKRPKSAWLMEQIARRTKVFVCAPILQEVLQGASSDMAFGRIRKQLESLAWVDMPDPQLSAILAARLYAQLRWRGITVRNATDCLIACVAVEHDLTLLHDDADFEKIAQLEPRLRLA